MAGVAVGWGVDLAILGLLLVVLVGWIQLLLILRNLGRELRRQKQCRRRATPAEEGPILEAMAALGVRVRVVWVYDVNQVNAYSPVRGCMSVTEGYLRAAPWWQSAILAHEAGHARLRHTAKAMAVAVVLEAGWVACLGSLVSLSSVGGEIALIVLSMVALVSPLVVIGTLGRSHEYAADRWAVEHGGITEGVYQAHLAAFYHHPPHMTLWDRLLATHPTPERRAARLTRWLRGRRHTHLQGVG